jgi:hypothetical protein
MAPFLTQPSDARDTSRSISLNMPPLNDAMHSVSLDATGPLHQA